MQIEGKDVGRIIRKLEDAENTNKRYALFEKNNATGALQPGTVQCYRDKGEANYAGFLASSVQGKNVEVLPVKEVLQDMQRQVALHQVRTQNWSEHPGLVIDSSRLRSNEIIRQDIFTDDIARKLKEQQIQPDVKQLREYIAKDQQAFTISGMGRENGQLKAVAIQIQQDAHRAFHITGIAPQPENERHKAVKTMQQEELLGGKLYKEDALGVKQMMQAQREAGNRFVAFENGQERITGRQFTGFENALQAVEFVHQKAKENQSFQFRSITVIEKEADRVLGNKMEISKASPQQDMSEKRSRGVELSR
jgi:hypothetical protein